MKLIKKSLLIYLLSLFLPLVAVCDAPTPPYFTLITVPKSGSHLIIKALHFLINSKAVWHTRFPAYQYIPHEEGFLYTHFCLSPELESDYAVLGELKKIILIRDFRDVAVSIVHQIKKYHWPGMTYEMRQAFLKLPFDEQLMFVINFEYDVKAIADVAPNSLQVSLIRLAEQVLRYIHQPNVITFRYEDLVGPNGGGTLAAQLKELHRLKEFLRLDMSDSVIEDIASKLYGDSVNPFGTPGFEHFRSTFNKGVIGQWQDAFNEEHKIAFKKKLGPLLIAMGYAEDDTW